METELKPCPFCGAKAEIAEYGSYSVYCTRQCVEQPIAYPDRETAIEAWNRRTPEILKVETNFYDKEEIYSDCTVQVLTNTATGDVSVGWWHNGT